MPSGRWAAITPDNSGGISGDSNSNSGTGAACGEPNTACDSHGNCLAEDCMPGTNSSNPPYNPPNNTDKSQDQSGQDQSQDPSSQQQPPGDGPPPDAPPPGQPQQPDPAKQPDPPKQEQQPGRCTALMHAGATTAGHCGGL